MQKNVSLAPYSTMRLGGTAAYLIEVESRQEVVAAVQWAEERQLPLIMIGGGSNIIWRDEGFPGLVVVNKIQGLKITNGSDTHYLTAGAGMNWDEFVARTVEFGLTGVECLSLIPGTVGATPIQNVGAYGQEVANTLVTLEAYDRQAGEMVTLRAGDCNFGYRTSRFKTTDKGRFLITAVTFFLSAGKPAEPYYEAVKRYLDEHGISEVTPQTMRQAVIAIRQAKLPDPAVIANNGSFFANPVVSSEQFVQLQADYPDIAHWETSDGRIKLSAAWLIEQAGFKDVHDTETGIGTWPAQPLVLINEHAQSTAQLLAFKQKVVAAIQRTFQVTLEQEPELLP
jgi:UDP-N-acetylmuramate dehydrogenase